MIKYECARCGKEAEYDPAKDAVPIRARIESEQFGRDVFYHAVRCPHCGMRNELKAPDDQSPPQKWPTQPPPGAAPPPGQKPAR
jgi:DNA-directed RNA polymerase subunit RPC12/RpoP